MPSINHVHQGTLLSCVQSLFPADKTLTNSKKLSNIKHEDRNQYLELDVWVPYHHLCFEFQDEYHYVSTWYAHITQQRIVQKDNTKKCLAQQKGDTLITVPCWWDGLVESLAATINFHRPDINNTLFCGDPIPLNPPPDFFKSNEIEGVGELMLASFPMMESSRSFPVIPQTWWLGEKYDGIRCCWNPLYNKLYTRTGKQIDLLPAVVQRVPMIFIDGEIWFGRGNFLFSTHILYNNTRENINWDLFRLIAFDNPEKKYHQTPFELRYTLLLESISISKSTLPVEIAPRLKCNSDITLQKILKTVIVGGGEGVIMRRVGSYYEYGRSPSLIKLKTVYGDMEGKVEKIVDNKYIVLLLPNGKQMNVPMNSIQIPLSSLSIGSIVSFTFSNRSRTEVPVNPIVVRVRTDLNWEQVLQAWASEKIPLLNTTNDFTARPQGFWNDNNTREFLENFVREKNLDPLLSGTWYSIQYSDIMQSKNGSTILQKYGGYINLVKTIFPDISFNTNLFQQASWKRVEDRRKFFENYAKTNGFDPLDLERWYDQPRSRIASYKGARGVMSHHGGRVSTALMDLFPNLPWIKSNFFYKSYWSDETNRKQFFLSFAKSHSFDPLVSSNWFLYRHKITHLLGAYNVLAFHRNSVAQALIDLFPEIPFDNLKFLDWHSRREWFEKYAKENNIDYQNSKQWYSHPRKKLLASMGRSNIFDYYNGNINKALGDLFPDMEC